MFEPPLVSPSYQDIGVAGTDIEYTWIHRIRERKLYAIERKA